MGLTYISYTFASVRGKDNTSAPTAMYGRFCTIGTTMVRAASTLLLLALERDVIVRTKLARRQQSGIAVRPRGDHFDILHVIPATSYIKNCTGFNPRWAGGRSGNYF